MKLCNDNNFKKKSLYDNVYFTLRDIFVNADTIDILMKANEYNDEITGGVYFEDRTDNFEYTNVLNQKDFVEGLLKWLNTIKNEYWFEFSQPKEGDDLFYVNEIDENIYIPFVDWWVQFEELKSLLRKELMNL